MFENCEDSPERLKEIEEEERSALIFGITVTELRAQRQSLGQLLTGPYVGCSPGFARTMEMSKEINRVLYELNAQ